MAPLPPKEIDLREPPEEPPAAVDVVVHEIDRRASSSIKAAWQHLAIELLRAVSVGLVAVLGALTARLLITIAQ